MAPNILDRRVQRTRKLLRDALLQLVQEKGYSSISIQDLAEQANLGKATFYLHYREKDELLYECMDMVLAELAEKIRALPATRWSSNDPRPLQMAFEFVARNAKFIKIMKADPGGLVFFQRLHVLVVGLVMETIKADLEALHTQPLVSVEVLSNYFAGAILASIQWWVDNDMQPNIDEMVAMLTKTAWYSREEILGMRQ